MSEIKFVVSQKDKVIESFTTKVEVDSNFYKTVENVQATANNILTKIIEDQGDNVEDTNVDDTNVDDTNADDTNVDDTNADDTNVDDTNVDDTNADDTNVDDTNVDDDDQSSESEEEDLGATPVKKKK